MIDVFVIVSHSVKAYDTQYLVYNTQEEFDWVSGKTDIVPKSIVQREFVFRTNNKYVSKKPKSEEELATELNTYTFYQEEDCRCVGAAKSFNNIMDYSNYILDKQTNILDTLIVVQV